MPGRPTRLSAVSLAMVAFLVCGRSARAHRLEGEYRVLPGGKVLVESWFDLTGDSPHGARVTVSRSDGRLLAEGELDAGGRFVFAYTTAEALHVAVSAGAGHRKDLDIPAAELAQGLSPTTTAGEPASAPGDGPPAPPPAIDRGPRVSVRDVLTGVGFVLAAAAFALSIRNARRLRHLARESRRRRAEGASLG